MENPFTNNKEYLSFYGIDQDSLSKYNVEKIKEGKKSTVIHTFEPKRVAKTVLLIHGYFDHTGGLKNMINHFLRKGWRVVSYDLDGHGLSSGERAEIEDFTEYVHTLQKVLFHCKENGYYPRTIIAHSTGAAVCTHFLLQFKEKFEDVIFLAPLVRPTNWRTILIASKVVPIFTEKLKRKFKMNSGDDQYLTFARNDPLQCRHISIRWVLALIKWNKKVEALPASTQKLNIIQGTVDQTVDWKYNISFLKKKFPDCQVAVIENGRHQLMNDHKTIKSTLLKIIDHYVE